MGNKCTFETPTLDYPKDKLSLSLTSEKYSVDGKRASQADRLGNNRQN